MATKIDLTPECLKKQLGLAATLEEIKKAVENTNNFNDFSKHIISFNKDLAVANAFVGISNSTSQFKVKCNCNTSEALEGFEEKIDKFSEKYKVTFEPCLESIKKFDDKNYYSKYYIIGKEEKAA